MPNFGDRTFQQFILDVTGEDLYGGACEFNRTSKAGHLRALRQVEDDCIVAKPLKALIECGNECRAFASQPDLVEQYLQVIQRLERGPGSCRRCKVDVHPSAGPGQLPGVLAGASDSQTRGWRIGVTVVSGVHRAMQMIPASASGGNRHDRGVVRGSFLPCPSPHIVSRRERFTGTVVAMLDAECCVVDLGNGCVGTLVLELYAAGLGDLGTSARVGAQLEVEVVRTVGERYTGPRSVVLQAVAVADARWAMLVLEHPVGSFVDVAVAHRSDGGYLMVSADGASGWLSDREVSWSRLDPLAHDAVASGQAVRLKVIGHQPRRRQMLFSLRQVAGHPLDRVDSCEWVGRKFFGVVAMVVHYGVLVRLPVGIDGLLHRAHLPRSLRLAVNDRIEVEVIRVDPTRRRIELVCADGDPTFVEPVQARPPVRVTGV